MMISRPAPFLVDEEKAQRHRRLDPLTAWLSVLCLAAALAFGCAEGAAVAEGGGDLMGIDMTADSGGGEPDLIAPGGLVVCVLNASGPGGACADPSELDFGLVAANANTLRLFRVANQTAGPVEFLGATTDTGSAEFTIVTVQYDGSLARSLAPMPTTVASGGSLFFEVTVLSSSGIGLLPASEVIVDVAIGAEPTQVSVPLIGEFSGCMEGFADCDGQAGNGCEADVATDMNNCGACGSACNPMGATAECIDGACTITDCDPGTGDCDADPRNGCETDTTFATANCGSCGTNCVNANGTTSCVSGNCMPVCTGPWGDCDGDPANGCEAPLDTEANCGACGTTCDLANAVGMCNGGACEIVACNSGFDDCDMDPANGCEASVLNDANNCGACGAACIANNGTNQCINGGCVVSCDDGFCDENNVGADGCEFSLNTNPGCVPFIDMGAVHGDSGSQVRTRTGRGENWYRIDVQEESSGFCSDDDLCMRADLTVPDGVDYNLYLYCDNCTGDDSRSATAGLGTDESARVRWEEDTILGCPSGSDSGRNIYIEVRFASGNVCDEYTLQLTGNSCAGSNTCSSK